MTDRSLLNRLGLTLISGYTVLVRSLDLDQESQGIRRNMLRLISELALEDQRGAEARNATVVDPGRIVSAETAP